MKTKLLWVLILLAQTFYAQEITGSWIGDLDIQGMKLPLTLIIKKENNKYISVAGSPKQSDKEIPVNKTEFINNELMFEVESLNASYKGQFKKDHFEGTFTQNSFSGSLNLYRNDGSKTISSKDVQLKDIGSRAINTAKIDDYLNYIVLNKQAIGSISIFKNGKEIYQKNFGQEQLPNIKWDTNTEYQIGSISKMITAVMIMQQVEKGKINSNDKLSKYYPDLPNAEKITLKSMLNHTSGLGDYVGQNYQWLFEKPVGDKAILDEIKKQGVSFQPGEKTRYSNSGYYLLSRILETVTKKPYNILLKENITDKANMKNTFSVLDNPKNVFASYENNTGKWTEMQDFDFHNCIGLGDISSTPNDMNLFINALFNYKFVKKETLDTMLPKSDKNFGLGMMAVPFYNKVSFGHGGDTAGTHSIVSYSPAENYSFAIMINGEKMSHNELSIGILNIMYDQNAEYPKFSEVKNIPKQELQKYSGDYTSADIPLGLKIFVKDETLFAQGTGQTAFPLEYADKDQFKYEKADLKLTFFPQKNELQMLQRGTTFNFKKK
ncbi:hypothetical protein ASG22_05930 [Chryseobacterium sp. Leaf405]|uniref:serine hydrolase domain-containing protein n=1 Tax=Chryseobacterium sp. Leaf405 TaxID=1736367 RepID=UPI0006F56BC7|nr:serine hydrolase domain-containing protein [Chryseobacterium sp. Leaf405]KQT26208.1 hypothetical protein ASG22_05930 [Chryseobacterium sp. Leaf405]